MCDIILFTSPKQGGILQSSGFLDLKSLMALSRTCKSNAFDELSLILLIESEMTMNHGVQRIDEAIAFCKKVYRLRVLRQWLERECDRATTMIPTQDMIATAVSYEVMLFKMLHRIPESERLQTVRKLDPPLLPLLYGAVMSDNPKSIEISLALFPESERSRIMSIQLHWEECIALCSPGG